MSSESNFVAGGLQHLTIEPPPPVLYGSLVGASR